MLVNSAMALAMVIGAATPVLAADPVDGALNAVYSAIAAAKAEGSARGIAAAFSPEATMIDPRPGPPTTGKTFEAAMAPMIERLKHDGVKVRTDYRLDHRTVLGQVAVDSGYMRTRFEAPAGAPKPNEQYSRFLVTLRKEPDGAWRIIGDASFPSSPALWDSLKPVTGLKFDE